MERERLQSEFYGATVGSSDYPTRSYSVANFTAARSRRATTFTEDPDPQGWEARGTSFGLLLDIAAGYGYYFVTLVALQVTVGELGDQLMQCKIEEGSNAGVYTGLHTYAGVCVCEYTKAFMLTFPAAASSAFLLLLGRDVLQKRLYYGLLKAGGVLRFLDTVAYRDPIMIAVLLSFGHCIWFVSLAFLIVYRRANHAESGEAFGVTVHHLSASIAAMIPATLVTVFCYLAYDIQKSLVPLSEYVADAEEGALEYLDVVSEHAARALLMEGPADLGTHGNKFEEMLEAYAGKFGKRSSEVTANLKVAGTGPGLLGSLWPARLLLPAKSSVRPSSNFRSLWNCVSGAACVWMLLVFYELVSLSQVEIGELLKGSWQKVFSLGVILGHMTLLGFAFQAFMRTLLVMWSSPPCAEVEVP